MIRPIQGRVTLAWIVGIYALGGHACVSTAALPQVTGLSASPQTPAPGGAPAPALPTTSQAKEPAPKSARLGQNVDIRLGETVTVVGEPLTVKFEQVVEDSRCPANATCIWAGRTVIQVALRNDKSDRSTLNLPAGPDAAGEEATGEGVFRKYRIRLVRLLPAPVDGSRISPDRYVATVNVRKVE